MVTTHAKKVCRSKRHYSTNKRAWEASLEAFILYEAFVTVYKCKSCKGFHLTRNKGGIVSNDWLKGFEKYMGATVPEIDDLEAGDMITLLNQSRHERNLQNLWEGPHARWRMGIKGSRI